MTSPVGGLINTIFRLQELRQRDEAAQLAREQFGLEQVRVGLSQQQMAEGGIQLAQSIAENVKDPSQFLQHVPVLSQLSGAPKEVLPPILQGTPPSAATIRNAAVASGAQQLGGALDTEAASAALTGQNLGAIEKSGLDQSLLGGAKTLLGQMDPAARSELDKAILQRNATGQDLKSAALDVMFDKAPQAVKNQAMQIGLGLAPDANSQLQARLGFQRLALETSAQAFEEQKGTLQMQIMRAEAEAKLAKDPEKFKAVDQLLHDYDQSLQDWVRNSATLTPQGQVLKSQALNGIADQLINIAPEIYGPQGTTPLKHIKPSESAAATSGFLKFFSKQLP